MVSIEMVIRLIEKDRIKEAQDAYSNETLCRIWIIDYVSQIWHEIDLHIKMYLCECFGLDYLSAKKSLIQLVCEQSSTPIPPVGFIALTMYAGDISFKRALMSSPFLSQKDMQNLNITGELEEINYDKVLRYAKAEWDVIKEKEELIKQKYQKKIEEYKKKLEQQRREEEERRKEEEKKILVKLKYSDMRRFKRWNQTGRPSSSWDAIDMARYRDKRISRWDSEDPYVVLDLCINATGDDLKKAYRSLAKIYHPDKTQGDHQENQRIFQKVTQAYKRIKDFEKHSSHR